MNYEVLSPRSCLSERICVAAIVGFLLLAAAVPVLAGNDPNACDNAGEEPDVIVGNLDGIQRWGKVGDITAFSLATTSCNLGTCWLDWFDDNGSNNENRHPVIAQSLYRLKDGRMEQIGQSWLKHGFFAVSGNFCESGCIATNGDHLGVNCSDPYSTNLNGNQNNLGPKSEVNATKGVHPHPFGAQGQTGNAIYKRLQVHDADLDPALNSGAQYFIEGQYVTEDDAGAANDDNNASHRPVTVDDNGGGNFDLDLQGQTVREQPAINAWGASDAAVVTTPVDVTSDGRFIVAGKATPLGGGMWNYEYGVFNLNSNRSAGAFSVPIPPSAMVTNIGFHDVDYHSGEPYDGTDWPGTVVAGEVVWATTPESTDPNANAVRWGTLYNFRFDANVPPIAGPATIGMFKAGSPSEVDVDTVIPAICNEDSICDLAEECICPVDCPGDGSDFDGDEVGQCIDCEEGDGDLWGTPGLVGGVSAGQSGTTTTLDWSAPLDPGGTSVDYEVLRSRDPSDFSAVNAICMADGDPTDTTVTDSQIPFPNNLYAYLIRATNACAEGVGSLGVDSDGTERSGRSCP